MSSRLTHSRRTHRCPGLRVRPSARSMPAPACVHLGGRIRGAPSAPTARLHRAGALGPIRGAGASAGIRAQRARCLRALWSSGRRDRRGGRRHGPMPTARPGRHHPRTGGRPRPRRRLAPRRVNARRRLTRRGPPRDRRAVLRRSRSACPRDPSAGLAARGGPRATRRGGNRASSSRNAEPQRMRYASRAIVVVPIAGISGRAATVRNRNRR
jgi:hypothetical protein